MRLYRPAQSPPLAPAVRRHLASPIPALYLFPSNLDLFPSNLATAAGSRPPVDQKRDWSDHTFCFAQT
jgi:hypothetical protein